MKEITLTLPDDLVTNFRNLSDEEKRMVSKFIEDTLQPTGGDQTIMALTLLDRGFDVSLVSKLSRLDETFVGDLKKGLTAE